MALTKGKFLVILVRGMEKRQEEFGRTTGTNRRFVETTGWDQVHGDGERINQLYGEWSALSDLWYEINLWHED